jgi:hypothetical protein
MRDAVTVGVYVNVCARHVLEWRSQVVVAEQRFTDGLRSGEDTEVRILHGQISATAESSAQRLNGTATSPSSEHDSS